MVNKFIMKRLLFLTLITLVSCENENSADVNQSSITTNPVYEYNGLSYNYIELNSPPFDGTIWITGDIITVNEPSVFSNVIFQGKSVRTMYDRRAGWITENPYIFNASYTDNIEIEIQINPEFTYEESLNLANKYGRSVGQLPKSLRTDVETMWIHEGEEAWGGGNNNILIHTGQGEIYENWNGGDISQETLIHEGTHTSLDSKIYGKDGWVSAVNNDQTYVSTYAKDYPQREDIAELFPLYIAVKIFPERISSYHRNLILSCCINRINYLDSLELDFEIYNQ